jgi:hypothetical protein
MRFEFSSGIKIINDGNCKVKNNKSEKTKNNPTC